MRMIKGFWNAQVAGHVVMWSFAAASIANVESFFATLHPGLPVLSWGLGIALGIGLVVMAGLLSGMVWDIKDARFQVVLMVTTGLSLLSGGIQAAAYAAHMGSIYAAIIVGLALPVIGELGVAIAVSAYSQAQRRQRMADAQNQLSDGVRAQIGDAIANIDRSKIEAQVNRAATLVTKAIVDSTIDDMLSDLRKESPAISSAVNNESAKPDSDLTPDGAEASVINTEINGFTQKMADAKRKKSTERQTTLLDILRNEFNGMEAEVLNKTELGGRLGCTRQTISSDLDALRKSGLLNLNGHVVVR